MARPVPTILFPMFLLLLSGTSCTNTGDHEANEAADPMARYIAGFSLLTIQNNHLKDSIRVRRFSELENITGVDTDSALAFLASLRDSPEEGKKLYQKMMQLYQSPKDTVTR